MIGLLACSGSDGIPTDLPQSSSTVNAVEYQAVTHLLESFPPQVQTEVTARNTAPDTDDIAFPDGCVVLLRAYDNPERSGAPVWDAARVFGCTMAIVEADIPAGESETFRTIVGAEVILGDSLPDADYYFAAVLRPNGTVVEVTAGEAYLAIPR